MERMTSHISWKLNMFETTNQKKVNYMMFTTLSNRWSFSQLAALNPAYIIIYIYIYTHLMFPLREAKLGEFPLPFLLRRTCEQSDASPLKQVRFLPCFGGWINPHGDCRSHGNCELALTCTDCWRFIYDSCPYLGSLYGWECWSTNSRYIYHHLFMSFHVEAFLFSDSITWKQPTQGKKTIEIQKWCHEAWTV